MSSYYTTLRDFDRTLTAGMACRARWTNSGMFFDVPAEVVRVNRLSVRIRCASPYEGDTRTLEFSVPRVTDYNRHSYNNTVAPLDFVRGCFT